MKEAAMPENSSRVSPKKPRANDLPEAARVLLACPQRTERRRSRLDEPELYKTLLFNIWLPALLIARLRRAFIAA
jgi:hypothetical protein